MTEHKELLGHRRGRRIRFRLPTWEILLGMAVVILIGSSSIESALGTANDLWGYLDVILITSAFALIGWRTGLVHVDATNDGLKIRNPLRTYRIAWQDIENFGVGRNRFALYRHGMLVTTNNDRIGLMGIPLGTDYEDSPGGQALKQLEAHRRAVTDGRDFDDIPPPDPEEMPAPRRI